MWLTLCRLICERSYFYKLCTFYCLWNTSGRLIFHELSNWIEYNNMKWNDVTVYLCINIKFFRIYSIHFWKLIHVDFSSSFTWGYKVGLLPFPTTDIDMASLVTSDASFLFSTCFNHQNYRNTCSISSSFNMCFSSLHSVFLINATNLTGQWNELNWAHISNNYVMLPDW